MGLGVLLVPLGIPRLDLVDACGLRRDTTPKALTTQMAECDLRHVEPTVVLGGRGDRSFIRESFRLRRIKGFLKCCFGRRMQIIHHAAHCLHMGIRLIHKVLEKGCPIHLGPLRRDFGMPWTSSGLQSHKHVGRPLALLRSVIPQGLARVRGERNPHFPTPLGGHCIHPPVGLLRIIRGCIAI
jgi:hypothetical protein